MGKLITCQKMLDAMRKSNAEQEEGGKCVCVCLCTRACMYVCVHTVGDNMVIEDLMEKVTLSRDQQEVKERATSIFARLFQAGRRASAKALRQKWVWCICRTAWKSGWLEERRVGAYGVREATEGLVSHQTDSGFISCKGGATGGPQQRREVI